MTKSHRYIESYRATRVFLFCRQLLGPQYLGWARIGFKLGLEQSYLQRRRLFPPPQWFHQLIRKDYQLFIVVSQKM